jgi:hypothetical protein
VSLRLVHSLPRDGALAAWCWLVTNLAGGCVYDPQDRCGPQQEISDVGACVCVAGLVLRGTSCEACPEHEREANGACQCDDGYERAADGQPCTFVVSAGLGASCDDATPCVDPVFNVCHSGGVGGSYCTRRGCESMADCGGDYACSAREPVPFCERPPVGQAAACETNASCAGTDATFCDSFISKRCLVPDCSLTTPNCFADWECCDLSGVGLPGLPKTVCVPAGECNL